MLYSFMGVLVRAEGLDGEGKVWWISVFSQMFAKVPLVVDVQRLQGCRRLVTSKDLKGVMCRLCKMVRII